MNSRHRLDHSPFLATPGKKIKLSSYDPGYTDGFKDKDEAQAALEEDKAALEKAQEILYASSQRAVLLIFQAMDAAGKDGTIKHVMSGVNPQGCSVHSFKAPSPEEVSRPFLWRYFQHVPAKGKIGIFNRSYYEEVLVTRVHTRFLDAQRLPVKSYDTPFWESRYADINAFEKHLANTGTLVIKFFLNVSKAEQKKRFLKRLNEEQKHWKFSDADIRERQHWNDYQEAYESMINATSTPHAPWHIIPADKKWFTRAAVADVVIHHLETCGMKYPTVTDAQLKAIDDARQKLESES
ncbi:polyphosphate kinase 2 family protein [Kamptonema cortianum]|nr:polyphosphate kinase 2 family protein [Kamptonema cortianum]MDL5046158.1 polyphosphate kinase 2 family protein [Oscillatoria amoena NRMC-F 0135]